MAQPLILGGQLPSYLNQNFLALPNIVTPAAEVGRNVTAAMSGAQAMGQQHMRGIILANQEKLRRAKQAALDAKMPPGYTEADLALLKAYAEKYGALPTGADGKYDFGAIQAQLAKEREQADWLGRVRLGEKVTEYRPLAQSIPQIPDVVPGAAAINESLKVAELPDSLESRDYFKVPGATPGTFDEFPLRDWGAISPAEQAKMGVGLGAVGSGSSGRVAGEETENQRLTRIKETRDAWTTMSDTMTKLNEAGDLIKNSDVKLVGPLVGNLFGQLYGQAEALFGYSSRRNGQRQLETLVADFILEKAGNMKGQLSDRDVKFLAASVPKLNDTQEFWFTWLDQAKRLLAQRMQDRAANLNEADWATTGTVLGVPDAKVEAAITQMTALNPETIKAATAGATERVYLSPQEQAALEAQKKGTKVAPGGRDASMPEAPALPLAGFTPSALETSMTQASEAAVTQQLQAAREQASQKVEMYRARIQGLRAGTPRYSNPAPFGGPPIASDVTVKQREAAHAVAQAELAKAEAQLAELDTQLRARLPLNEADVQGLSPETFSFQQGAVPLQLNQTTDPQRRQALLATRNSLLDELSRWEETQGQVGTGREPSSMGGHFRALNVNVFGAKIAEAKVADLRQRLAAIDAELGTNPEPTGPRSLGLPVREMYSSGFRR